MMVLKQKLEALAQTTNVEDCQVRWILTQHQARVALAQDGPPPTDPLGEGWRMLAPSVH